MAVRLPALAERGRHLPAHVREKFEAYLKCGRLEHGFLRIRCTTCHAERLVAFSCKRRGFCPSCGARRMVESAALLVDEVLPREPVRQWVLSVPFPLRFLFAAEPAAMGEVLAIVWRAISAHRRLRAPQPVASPGHAGGAGERQGSRGHPDAGRAAPCDELGAAAEAVVPA
jgi:ribosomal protein S27E